MELQRKRGASGQASLRYQMDSYNKYPLGKKNAHWQNRSNDGLPISISPHPIALGSRLYAR